METFAILPTPSFLTPRFINEIDLDSVNKDPSMFESLVDFIAKSCFGIDRKEVKELLSTILEYYDKAEERELNLESVSGRAHFNDTDVAFMEAFFKLSEHSPNAALISYSELKYPAEEHEEHEEHVVTIRTLTLSSSQGSDQVLCLIQDNVDGVIYKAKGDKEHDVVLGNYYNGVFDERQGKGLDVKFDFFLDAHLRGIHDDSEHDDGDATPPPFGQNVAWV